MVPHCRPRTSQMNRLKHFITTEKSRCEDTNYTNGECRWLKTRDEWRVQMGGTVRKVYQHFPPVAYISKGIENVRLNPRKRCCDKCSGSLPPTCAMTNPLMHADTLRQTPFAGCEIARWRELTIGTARSSQIMRG